MTWLISGVGQFRKQLFGEKKLLFEELQSGQRPLALFITCADLRIDPNLLTQTAPGELFVLRTAGNIVAPFGNLGSGEGATIDYAVRHLHVRDIILCGHSRCGAMQGLLVPAAVSEMQEVLPWLRVAEPAVVRARKLVLGAPAAVLLEKVIEQNVLLQVEHLQTYPAVSEAAVAGRLGLHGWVYQFETGQVMAYNARTEEFVSLAESPNEKLLIPVVGHVSANVSARANAAIGSRWLRLLKRLWTGQHLNREE